MPKDRKLKVGLVFDDSLDSTDGVAQYVKTLGGWLSAQGHQVVYLVGQTRLDSWDSGKVYSLSRNINVKFNGNRLSMPLLPRLDLIDKVIKKEKFDVLHVMLPCSPLMAGRILAAVPKRTAVVGTFHIFPSGWLAEFGSRLLRLALSLTLRRFSAIVSVSRPAQRFARQAYGINSSVLPNPVRLESFKKNQRSNVKDNRIVFLGRLVARKGCRQLIDAFELLSKKHTNIKLVIAGTGPQAEDLKKTVSAKGLDKKVDFLGYVDESDKPGLLASASVACFPSLYGESFGIVLIEAMAAGAMVLGGDNPGYRSVLGDNPVQLVDPRNTKTLADRLERALSDINLRQEILNWQSSEVKKYDIGVVGPKVVDMYLSSIAKADKKSHN